MASGEQLLESNQSRFAEARQVVMVTRHGDRHDYAHPQWRETMREVCGRDHPVRDPPLSSLGHEQALAFTRALTNAGRPCTRVISSPYLRCIQTAVGSARSSGVKLELDPGIAEVWHKPRYVAPLAERYRYFPEIDLQSPRQENERTTEEQFPDEYLERIDAYVDRLIHVLDRDNSDRSTTLLVSHAASVAIVARLARVPLDQSLAFAPCGCYVLARDRPDQPFDILRRGDSNQPYVHSNSDTTTTCAMFSSASTAPRNHSQ